MSEDENASLVRVRLDGRELELGDLSRWEVDPGDSTITVLWLPTNRLKVEDTEAGDSWITNLDTAGPDKVRARKIFG
jgi:hypothetical protein